MLEADRQPCKSTDPIPTAEPGGISTGTGQRTSRNREGENIFLLLNKWLIQKTNDHQEKEQM